ncbi:phage holin family protein [Acidocella sp. C78]|uniref:phage holin family protein n=1 Tax=Acidocella sp. C78 TaxID=1671486 RepID=UPI00191BB786|nr:hypothetical protein [Acidocella sp. C78]
MLRVLVELFDGVTLRRLGARIGLAAVALALLLAGLGLLLAAAAEALGAAIGPVHAALALGGGLILVAAALHAVGTYRWRHRRRPVAEAARAGVLREGLAVALALLRRDPAKMVLAGLVLGALAEYLQDREPDDAAPP